MPHHITKTRYAKLVELVKSIIPDDESKCEQIMNGICNIFEYDPNASTYTPQQAAAIVKSRKKIQGIPVYVASRNKRTDDTALAFENTST